MTTVLRVALVHQDECKKVAFVYEEKCVTEARAHTHTYISTTALD